MAAAVEELSHDLPTLHRPVSREDLAYLSDEEKQRPLPTPPHKAQYHASRPCTGSYRESRGTIPHVMTAKNWQAYRAKRHSDELPELEDFDRSYRELSSRTAYRYPHPGTPKDRQGCIGGSWRHMKEAIGYGPGRLMWIDGVISLYDHKNSLNKEKPWERSAPFTAVSSSVSQPAHSGTSRLPPLYQQRIENSEHDQWYSSNRPQSLPFAVAPPMATATTGRHRGFYSMAQSYT